MPRSDVNKRLSCGIGRVGLPMGTAIIGSSRSSCSANYRVGLTCTNSSGFGHSPISKSHTVNTLNWSVNGRRMPVGNAVAFSDCKSSSASTSSKISSSRGSNSSSNNTVGNILNRRDGKMGLPVGNTAVSKVKSDYTLSSCTKNSATCLSNVNSKTYADNALNSSVFRVGSAKGSTVMLNSATNNSTNYMSNTSSRNLEDRALNRCVNSVDLPIRSAKTFNGKSDNMLSSGAKNSASCLSNTSCKLYVANDLDRRVQSVGLPTGNTGILNAKSDHALSSAPKNSACSTTSVDSAVNRGTERVELPMKNTLTSNAKSNSSLFSGTMITASSYSHSSSKICVDSAVSRNIGRVELPVGGAAVFSGIKSNNVSSSDTKNAAGSQLNSCSTTNADNPMKCSSGKFGMLVNRAVVSRKNSTSKGDVSHEVPHSKDNTKDFNILNSSPEEKKSSCKSKNIFDSSDKNGSGLVERSCGAESNCFRNVYSKNANNILTSGSKFAGLLNASGVIIKKVHIDNAMNKKLTITGHRNETWPITKNTSDQTIDEEKHANRGGAPVRSSLFDIFCGPVSRRNLVSNTRTKKSATLFHDFLIQMMTTSNGNPHFKEKYANTEKAVCSVAVDRKFERINKAAEIQKRQQGTSTKLLTSNDVMNDMNHYNIISSEFKIGQIIGRGSFGEVFMCKYKGTTIAIKKLRSEKISSRKLNAFRDEVKNLCKLRHENVVRCIGACVETRNLCICMEYMSCSLYDALHMDLREFNECEKLNLCSDITKGLGYLHANKVAHCNIKSANVLIDYNPFVAKLTDFGLAVMNCEAESTMTLPLGYRLTPRYSAPEVLRGEKLIPHQWEQADIYSLSLVFFELACEVEPFDGLSLLQLIKQVGEKHEKPTIPHGVYLDTKFYKQLGMCWDTNSVNRPTAVALGTFLVKHRRMYADSCRKL